MRNTISIIIPVYNMEAFLAECLDSVLAQTYPHLEVLCVNDGSKDRSQEILEDYARRDARIRPIVKENGGLSSARNRGLEEATGAYVMYLDSDDWLDPDICRAAVEEMERSNADLVMWSYIREYQTHSKPTDVLGTERRFFDEAGVRQLHRRLFGLVGQELADPSRGDIIVTAWGKLYRRELIRGIKFIDTKKIGTEDSLYNIQAFRNLRSAVYLPLYGIHYRKYNAASLTTAYNPRLFAGWQNMYELMAEQIRIHDLPAEYSEALSNRRAVNLIALSVNIMAANKTAAEKRAELRDIILRPNYREAFRQLDLGPMPIHWKAFFLCARHGFVPGLYLLLLAIQKIRGR